MGLTAERLDELEKRALGKASVNSPVLVHPSDLLRLVIAARAPLWRPISEAPKDGTFVLFATADCDDWFLQIRIAWWEASSGSRWELVDENTKKRRFYEDGYWEGDGLHGPSGTYREPTHFMLLSEPPE